MTALSGGRGGARLQLVVAAALTVAVALAFGSVGGCDFFMLDDHTYVTENPHVLNGLTGDTMFWAFSSFRASNWHPITWLSHMADVELFGREPAGHHLTSLILHILNTVLLFDLLQRMTGARWRSALVAALFGLHPVHVETVVWISERKDVLCTFFWFLATGAYVRYAQDRNRRAYPAVPVFYALALMSKPMAVTFPFLLLLLDYWPLARVSRSDGPTVRKLLAEKIPLFLMSLASSFITLTAQWRGGAMSDLHSLPFSDRLANAVVSLAAYVRKTIWPMDLAAFYPHPGRAIPPVTLVVAGVFLLVVTHLVIRLSKRRPYLPVGWFWFLGTLVPVLGLIQVGGQGMADRYLYVPAIGLFIMMAWSVGESRRWRWGTVLSMLVLLGLAGLTHRQVGFWKTSDRMMARALAVTEGNWPAMINLADIRMYQQRYDEALRLYQRARSLQPDRGDVYHGLGSASAGLERLDAAIGYYLTAVELNPYLEMTHYNLAKIMVRLGRPEAALEYFRGAVSADPGFHVAYNDLGVLLFRMGRRSEAIAQFLSALAVQPDYYEARNNLHYLYRQRTP